MSRLRPVLALATILSGIMLAGPVMAGKFRDGLAALRAGDDAAALKDWRSLATQGDARAQLGLGLLYAQGHGVPQDYTQAAEWYRRAAKQGNALAQLGLGYLYAQGHGVPQNYTQAAHWFRLAAKQGNAGAQSRLGYLYDLGLGVPQDYAQAAEWYRLAAKQGNAVAQSNLGALYALGHGVPRNYVESYKWRNLAAAQGVTQAAKALDALSTFMTSSQIAEAQRLSAAFRPQIAGARVASAPPLTGRHPAGDLGSGFFVAASGLVLTNAHVVDRCRQIDVRTADQASAARLLGRDTADDLALLATGLHPDAVAALRLSARQGDAIAVYGFPLPGLLAPVGNVTFGNITALAGVGGSSGEMQISAPVQPGNSGGPVLDSSGDVVGVVVAKLDALRVAVATRDIPQNVNFAIKATVATDFLQAQGVTFTRGKARAPLSSAALAAAARPFTVQVECTR